MKEFKSFIKETLTHIPPNVSKTEYSDRADKIKNELEKKTGMKYSHVGNSYNSDKSGNSTHILISDPFKTEHNKEYGGATSHHVRAIVNSKGKVSKVDSISHAMKREYGEMSSHDYIYHHKSVKNIDGAVDHMNETKSRTDPISRNNKHVGTILYPNSFK